MPKPVQKEESSLRKKVITDSVWSLSTAVIAKIGGLIFTIIAARILLPDGFGLYNLALSIAMIFLTFADLGVNKAMIRYLSFELNKNKNKAIAYYNYFFKIKLTLAFGASLLIFLTAYPLSMYIFRRPELFLILIILGFYVLTLAVEGFFESVFYISNKVSYVVLKESLFQVLRIGFLILAAYLFSKSNYVLGFVTGLLFTIIILLIVVFIFSRKLISFPFSNNGFAIDKRKIWAFVGFLTIVNLSDIFFSYMDTVMLGIFISDKFIGFYRAGIGFIFAVTGAFSFYGIFLSALTKVKKSRLQSAFDNLLHYLFALVIPAVVSTILLSNYIILIIYGYEYLPAAPILYFLSPMILFVPVVILFANLLSSQEKTRSLAYLTLSITVLNIMLNYILIKIFIGISEMYVATAVAFSTTFSWLIYFIMAAIISKKELGISLKLRLLARPLLSSLVLGIFLYTFNHLVHDMTPAKGLLEIAAGLVIYFGALIIFGGIEKRDIKLISNMFFRRKN